MVALSILDICPVVQDSDPADAIRQAVPMAQAAEASGYTRYWFAEHHAMPGVASSAPAVLIGHVAAATETIRVGSGGVMLPNHAPLVVAEQFGTLDALHPGRIDLGLGRATGGDPDTARALRRDPAREEAFADEVRELISLMRPYDAGTGLRAIPGAGAGVPLWILGSSLAGAQVAAYFGTAFAFAAHFAPDLIDQALEIYRTSFRPSRFRSEPLVMIAVNACVAETDDEAHHLHTSLQQAFAQMAMGRPDRLPLPVADITRVLPAPLLSQVDRRLAYSAVGAPARVAARLDDVVRRHRPQELILSHLIADPSARRRSIELAARARPS